MELKDFTQHVLPVRGRLFRLAQLFLRNRQEAEDAIQDVLLRLWSNRGQLEEYNSVEALAVKMTRNICLDRLKAHGNQKNADDAELSSMQSEGASPYRQTELADSARLMRQLIDTLPEQQKLVLHFRDVEDYTFEEIEQLTGISTNTLRVILSRARQRLRDSYIKINQDENGY